MAKQAELRPRQEKVVVVNASRFLIAALAVAAAFSLPSPLSTHVSWSHPPEGLSVPAKQTLTITTDRSAAWSLQPGSEGKISVDRRTVTYSAPSVMAQNAIAGCQVLPADTVYTTPIDRLPVNQKSAEWIASVLKIGSVGLSFGEAWGQNIVDSRVPLTDMTFLYSKRRNGAKFQIISGNDRNREGGALPTDGGADHHMIIINRETCHFYETYHDFATGLTPKEPYTANSGYEYSSSSYSQPVGDDGGGTTDAAGLPLLPLTVHLSEWEAGEIHHALRFTSCLGCISSPPLWPAVSSTASAPGAPPMGSRWRLKASFDTSRFSPKAQVILTALQRYGMFLADVGGMQQVQVDDDINRDPTLNAAFVEIQKAHITQASFDIVDESSFITSPSSSRVNPANGFVKPPNFVQLNGVDGKGRKLSIPISIQPVLVGVPHEALLVQAGTKYKLSAWVNNASDESVHWTLTSGPGEVTPSGLYLPPPAVPAPEPYLITATAAADSTAKATIRGFVLPRGAIRIDVGSPRPYRDSHGQVWMADTLGVYSGSYNNDDQTYPGSKWAKVPDAPLYAWNKYTWGDDIVYGPFIVPDGRYRIQFLFAEGNCTGKFDPKRKFDGNLMTGGVLGLEANGKMTPFDFGKSVDDECLTPATSTISTNVTNNMLTVALRATGSDAGHQAPFLSALAIIPE
jgi:hypothetical protein